MVMEVAVMNKNVQLLLFPSGKMYKYSQEGSFNGISDVIDMFSVSIPRRPSTGSEGCS